MTKKPDLHRIESGVYYSTIGGGIYETSKAEVEPDSLNTNANSASAKPWARWGTDNNYPQRLIDAVSADPSASLLEKRRAMHWGRGLMFFKRIVAKGRSGKFEEHIEPIATDFPSAEVEDWFFENDINNFQQLNIGNYEWWQSLPIQYQSDSNGRILRVKAERMKDVRCEIRSPKTGKIENFYLSGYWPDPQPEFYAQVPAFDRMGNGSGLYLHGLPSIDKDYYPSPAWHGVTRWLYIAAKIPRWILANIDNSINLKYHVIIPLEYFFKRHPEGAYNSAEERMKAIQEDEQNTYRNMDKFLAGEKNVSKAFYSKVAIGEDGKALPGWEIKTIPNDVKDGAWLNAYGVASMAIVSGNAMSPSLGGITLPNGLGSGSGSDLREQFNFYMQVITAQPRQTTLEWYDIVRRRNKWPKDVHLGYRDVILQSTDQAKSGYASPTEEAPTSGNQDNNKTQP